MKMLRISFINQIHINYNGRGQLLFMEYFYLQFGHIVWRWPTTQYVMISPI